jgi:hypothetical protein
VRHTFETGLDVAQEMPALLAANAAHWSWGLRKTWSLRYRQGLSEAQVYAALKKCGFTSEQVGSLLIAAEMRHSGLVELKKYELASLNWQLPSVKKPSATSRKRLRRWKNSKGSSGHDATSWPPNSESHVPKNIWRSWPSYAKSQANWSFAATG